MASFSKGSLVYDIGIVLFIVALSLMWPLCDCSRGHGHQRDSSGRRYQRPKETKGVLKKHAEVSVEYTEQLDPHFSLPCPERCSCHLLKIYCDGQDMTQLPRHIPPEAEVLMAKENSVKRIWQEYLSGLSALKHLNLKNNKIQYVESSAFIDLELLNSLNLMGNRLRYLSPDVFRKKKHLQFLSLKDNKIANVERLFRKLPSLHLLNIGGNRVRRISEMTFKNNPRLRVLDLHDNKITYINKCAFKGLPLLKFLILRDNPLTIVDLNFKLNFHLELLDFTNCKLTRMVHGLPHSIRDLRLAENAITKLEDDDFKTTRKIRLLVLDQNRIEQVSNGTFKRLWQLYDLYMSKNRIDTIPEKLPTTLHGFYANHNHIRQIKQAVFERVPNLEFLFLKDNVIQNVDADGFRGLMKLKSLDLSKNGLEDLQPLAFSNLTKLQVLDLSENPLDSMEHNCFDGLRNLHILQMSSVATSKNTPPVIFKDMRRLLFLDLQNSSKLVRHLSENPYVLRYLRSVEDLNLIDDGLYGLPKSFPKHFPHLKTVKMVGNPWHCDLSIYWLTLWMRRSRVKFFKADQMVCASPPHLLGRKIQSLREDELPQLPPPNLKKSNHTIYEIPFKHSLKKNVTLFFNISVEDDQKNGKSKLARLQFGKHKAPHQSRHANKRYKKTRYPHNDVILGDSGAVYQSSGSSGSLDTGLLDSIQKADIKPDIKSTLPPGKVHRSRLKTSEETDGSGNIAVTGALAQRALRESSGESEPFLI